MCISAARGRLLALGASLNRKFLTRFQGIRSFSPQLIELLLLPFTLHPSILPETDCTWDFHSGDVQFDYTAGGVQAKTCNGYHIPEEQDFHDDDDHGDHW